LFNKLNSVDVVVRSPPFTAKSPDVTIDPVVEDIVANSFTLIPPSKLAKPVVESVLFIYVTPVLETVN